MAEDFKVVIVGGSVAGLSLAHCLERLAVSFTILERGDRIAPQLGASVGILPNGGRILDQLGLFQFVEDEIDPLDFALIRYSDGFSFKSQYPTALRSSYGYPVSFLERQKFLQILYDKLKGKKHIHTGKKVVAVLDDGHEKAVVKTLDGSEYAADLVVGADGVHSIVRSEIWRHLRKGAATADEPFTGIKCEYSCIYGTSTNVPHVQVGAQLSFLTDGVSIHVFSGKKSKLFWFIMVKTSPDEFLDMKKDAAQTARRICQGLGTVRLSDAMYFRDVWSRCTIYKMTPLEEGVFKQWNCGRLVCVGDAIRKVNGPNIGQGANMAIEDAAQVANLISKAHSRPSKLSGPGIASMLDEFAALRRARTASICQQSEFLVRMHANQGFGRRLLGRYLVPLLNDVPAGLSSLSIRGAAKLDFADAPPRSLDKAWGGSWRSSLRSVVYLRPGPVLQHALLVVGGLVVLCLGLWWAWPVR
uniref:FAD dependent monooxygenase n=1 Tax=Aciculosporium take TaxID=42363 RepID=J7FI36_9HYPO|nr:FAD dependent monooxygenase [Aciculosporium take]